MREIAQSFASAGCVCCQAEVVLLHLSQVLIHPFETFLLLLLRTARIII